MSFYEVSTLIPEKFKEFITDMENKQELKYLTKKRMNLMVLPEFIDLFENS